MKRVTMPMRPRVRPPELSEEAMRAFTQRLSPRECALVCELVLAVLWSRGFRRIVVGSRHYNAVEAWVCAELVHHEVDVWEVAAQMEEAKARARWEGES